MSVRFFVSSTAALLVAWLGITYVRQVPWQAYPVMGKGGVPMAAKPVKPAVPAIDMAAEGAPEELPLAGLAE